MVEESPGGNAKPAKRVWELLSTGGVVGASCVMCLPPISITLSMSLSLYIERCAFVAYYALYAFVKPLLLYRW